MTTSTAPAKAAYRELGLLAEGGMALVVRAVRESDGRDVVVKRVRPPLCFDAGFLQLFKDEGALHAALDEQAHEHVVRLLDMGSDEQGPFLVFEHVDGTDLQALMQRASDDGTPLDVELVLAVAIPVAAALAFVHTAERNGAPLCAVHRDVSPANVLLADDGSVKLADFGVAASRLKTEVTQAGELKGKFAYMAPEQTRGERATPAADLFALGVVLWECLANRRLFDAPTDADVVQKVRHGAAPRLDDPSVRAVPLEAPLANLVAALLDKLPERRPPSARAVVEALTAVALERGLDEGLRRHVARAVRAAPRRSVSPLAPDVPRRRTQRVIGLATADTVRRLTTTRGRIGAAAALAAAAALTMAIVSRTAGGSDDVGPLPPSPLALHAPPPEATAPSSSPAAAPPPETTAPASSPAVAPPPATPPPPVAIVPPTRPKPAPPPPAAPPVAAPPVAPASEGFGRLSITSEPWARVRIDGVEAARETPLLAFSLRAGPHEVTLENPVVGLKKTLTIFVGKDEHVRRFVDLQRP